MGYYDDGQYRSTKKRGPGSNSFLRWVTVVVASVLIGSASTIVAVPIMLQNNLVQLPALTNPNLQNTSYRSLQPVTVQLNNAIVQAVQKVRPSVVGVINFQMLPNYSTHGYTLQEEGVGSGVIFSHHGYIVTNYHVVQGASKVEVVVQKKYHVYAHVVGYDPYTDLAVLKIPSSYVKAQDVAQFGNSTTLQAGEPAIAIGNPAGLDFADTVTSGVISATQRTMPVIDEATGSVIGQQTELQTDAAINPGNSGGPLCNIEGQVIGINNSKIVAQGFEGMGFAIPINEVRTIVDQILATGHAIHPALGIEAESLSAVPAEYQPNVPVNYGVWVVKVVSAAARAGGLEHGDVIVAVNGQKISGITSLRSVLWKNYKPGQSVAVTVYRDQQKLTLHVKLGELPPPQNSPSAGGSQSNGGGAGNGGGSNGFSFP
ncbi:MAG: S1C family serine protease [Bacilli bacterium]